MGACLVGFREYKGLWEAGLLKEKSITSMPELSGRWSSGRGFSELSIMNIEGDGGSTSEERARSKE
jgi:hypothetical protein